VSNESKLSMFTSGYPVIDTLLCHMYVHRQAACRATRVHRSWAESEKSMV